MSFCLFLTCCQVSRHVLELIQNRDTHRIFETLQTGIQVVNVVALGLVRVSEVVKVGLESVDCIASQLELVDNDLDAMLQFFLLRLPCFAKTAWISECDKASVTVMRYSKGAVPIAFRFELLARFARHYAFVLASMTFVSYETST